MLRDRHRDTNLLDGISSCQKHTHTQYTAMCTVVFGPQRSVGCVPQKVTPALPGTRMPTSAEPSQASWWPALCSLLTSGVHSLHREHHHPRNIHAPTLSCSSILFLCLYQCQGRAALAATDHHCFTTLTFAMPHEQHNHAAVPTVTSRPTEPCRVTSDIQQQLDVMFPMAFFFPSKS